MLFFVIMELVCLGGNIPMAFNQQISIEGDATYRLSKAIKKYTLGDLGFIPNNAGTYVLHRSLEPEKPLENAIQLKVSVTKDLRGFKLSTVSAGDMARINIFKMNNNDMIKLYAFFIDELIARGVIEKI